ncbi:MAG: serine/threonine protein kinase [Planctomycetales bacterium]|nr:serine/threonine protein kinase [Planctomycetales bacterium]
MTLDRTQAQSTEDQRQSQDLSRARTAPPIVIEGYEPRQFLGAGAFGEVWVALDQNTGRRVAIKFFGYRGGLDWSMLSREVEKLVFLSEDRYVVQLLDVGWNSDPPYYVMEYVENGSLEDFLQRRGPLPVGEAVEIFRAVAIGLSRAHGRGVLHCDLKPANILLDQDNLPRLADFGQSRLTHEQTPALGTLFYMAPEQADLEAVPDARWDVYALGALLYCMLTGSPPHRTDAAVSEIDSNPELTERLSRYRDFIVYAPPLQLERQVPELDRSIVEIIERCLAVDPERRFPNIQSVLDALQRRDTLRDRRPLVLLGLVGPLMFLVLTSMFAWLSHQRAVGDADQLLLVRAQESNGFAADFVSEAVARRIENYFRAVEEASADPELLDKVRAVLNDNEIEQILQSVQGVDPLVELPQRERLRNHPIRLPLQQHLEELLDNPRRPEIASWFVTDKRGIHIATAVGTSPENSPIGGDFSHRTYFHGGPNDVRPDDGHAIEQTHFSAVFKSTTTLTWKVAVSTPLLDRDGKLLGVLAFTVELGRLGDPLENTNNPNQFNVLVDGRAGDSRGVILHHPLFDKLLREQKQLDVDFSNDPRYRVPLDEMQDGALYRDPMGQHAQGGRYNRRWVAAKRAVRFESNDDTGLIVLRQEDYDVAAAPVHQLGDALLRHGLTALASVVSLFIALWYFVSRALSDPNETIRRQGGLRTSPTTISSMETIELPHYRRESGR